MNDWNSALDEVARSMKGQPSEVILESLRAATGPDDAWDEAVMVQAASEIANGVNLHFNR
ncbi:hypothetical protein G3T36_01845 [Diaminobutyricibacter tongyongensis]|uniref:Uncharacterized protein n=1 Tax=Leifsonia tongyongensis TaxID=1268043 RepID=A0A6L9XTG4_9MICO|nr:hypothetical protein [Diaminobutyricibacter tongyongensis]NEN04606.1 hypothetical protein [Diaminobutyricibacter tongyongensis]